MSGSPASVVDAGTDWLRIPTQATRSSQKSFLEKETQRDGFLSFAVAMRTQGDAGRQESMLTKVYLFMRDNLPDGLVGDWGHIEGNDVMIHLLCCPEQTAPSRHKATKHAEAAFKQLEAWMAEGATWKEAHERVKIEMENERSKKASKRKNGPTAPGLHTPAGRSYLLDPSQDFLLTAGTHSCPVDHCASR